MAMVEETIIKEKYKKSFYLLMFRLFFLFVKENIHLKPSQLMNLDVWSHVHFALVLIFLLRKPLECQAMNAA